VTAVLSATAFAGIAGGLAATHADAAPAHPSPARTTPTTVAPDPGGSVDDGNPNGQGWTATPGGPIDQGGSFGQDGQGSSFGGGGQVGGDNHGQSGAS